MTQANYDDYTGDILLSYSISWDTSEQETRLLQQTRVCQSVIKKYISCAKNLAKNSCSDGGSMGSGGGDDAHEVHGNVNSHDDRSNCSADESGLESCDSVGSDSVGSDSAGEGSLDESWYEDEAGVETCDGVENDSAGVGGRSPDRPSDEPCDDDEAGAEISNGVESDSAGAVSYTHLTLPTTPYV